MTKEDFEGFYGFAVLVAGEIQKRDLQISKLIKDEQAENEAKVDKSVVQRNG